MKNIFHYLIVALFVVLIFGCSERKDDAPLTQTAVTVHGVGFKDPASSNFHAKYLQANNFDLQLCRSCHGADYSGGTTGQSCNTCHNKQNGPENCMTCHGTYGVNAAPPKDLAGNTSATVRGVGAHQDHLSGDLFGAPVRCAECHRIPANLSDAGHIDATNHAEINFDTTSIFFKSNAVYTAANVSCTNTYCHGNFPLGNANVTMTWTDTSSTAVQCGTCHGDITKTTLKEKAFPKTGHTYAAVTSDCSTCHGAVVNASLTIIDPSKHINGRLN